jgi:hypothetical protein
MAPFVGIHFGKPQLWKSGIIIPKFHFFNCERGELIRPIRVQEIRKWGTAVAAIPH